MSDGHWRELVLPALQSQSAWELLAVILGVAYLLLAMRENQWCWPAALVSTAIYTVIFWRVALLMDSLLNLYYMAMAVYGAWAWRRRPSDGEVLHVSRWSARHHLLAIGAVLLVSAISGRVLQHSSHEAWPYLDSFTTWASVLTTWMVARKILENWLYWIVIDAVSLVLYVERGLYPTALLFAAYVVLAIVGFYTWRRHLRDQQFAEKCYELSTAT